MNISEAIKQAMKQKGVNITELAKQMGYSVQYISDILSGDRRWNETTLTKACRALGMRLEFVPEERPTLKTGTEYGG